MPAARAQGGVTLERRATAALLAMKAENAPATRTAGAGRNTLRAAADRGDTEADGARKTAAESAERPQAGRAFPRRSHAGPRARRSAARAAARAARAAARRLPPSRAGTFPVCAGFCAVTADARCAAQALGPHDFRVLVSDDGRLVCPDLPSGKYSVSSWWAAPSRGEAAVSAAPDCDWQNDRSCGVFCTLTSAGDLVRFAA